MKRLTIIILLTACMANIGFAQFSINSKGRVSIDRTITGEPLSLFTVGNVVHEWIQCIPMMASYAALTSNYNIGIEGTSGNLNYSSNGRAFGVRGIAAYSTNGYNYGVYGFLYTYQNGAAIFGTVNNTNGVYVNGRYAGYFDGNTKIDGVLTVTGGINGIILGNEATSTSRQSLSLGESGSNNVSGSLTGINAIAYFKDQPENTATEQRDSEIPVSTLTTQNLSKKHYGLSATQLELIYPDLVYENEDGTKSINYVEMIPLLVQAVNELKARIAIYKDTEASAR